MKTQQTIALFLTYTPRFARQAKATPYGVVDYWALAPAAFLMAAHLDLASSSVSFPAFTAALIF